MEMIIAISIFTLGIAGFTLLFSRSWKSNSFIVEEGMAAMQASNSVRNISRDLREIRQAETGEYMVKTAEENELVVYFDVDGDDVVERVRFYVDEDTDTFIRGVAEASGSPLAYPADYSADIETVLANYVMNGSLSELVFKYYDNENMELVSPAPTDIRLIEVNLWINIKPLSAPDNVKIGTSIELRNLDENI